MKSPIHEYINEKIKNMNKKLIAGTAVLLLFSCNSKNESSKENTMSLDPNKAPIPVAEKKEHWRTIHGDSVLDNYYWMYDYFGKGPDSTKAVDYLKAENSYLDAVMADTK